MGLKDELDDWLAPLGDEANELLESWAQLGEEDLHMVLGKFFGLAFKAIGQLCDGLVMLAGRIDALEDRQD